MAEAADEVGLGWRAAMRAVVEHATVPDRFRPVRRLGLDETVSRRRRPFVTHLVDLYDGTVVATVEGRSAAGLLKALAAQGDEWLAGVEQVAIDPFTPYAKAVRRLCATPGSLSTSSMCCACSVGLSTRFVGARCARQRADGVGRSTCCGGLGRSC